MDILVFTGFYEPGFKGGGPIKTIKGLIEKTGERMNYKVVTRDRDLGDSQAYQSIESNRWKDNGNVEVFYSSPGFLGLVKIAQNLKKAACDVVYLNSLFSFRFSTFPLILSCFLGKKIVLAPRGELSFGALNSKAFKKKLFLFLFKLVGLHKRVVFQASSQREKMDINGALGTEIDVRIAENISSHYFASIENIQRSAVVRIISVSRISPKKNVLFALEVLKHVKSEVEYHIYGPIEDRGYWEKCENVLKNLPDNIRVTYKGAISPEDVVDTMSRYDMFFFPTKGENYGHVIAEALCAGLPLLISNTTPWTGLSEKGIGWDLPLDNKIDYAKVIDDFALLKQRDYQIFRNRVLSWAKNKFSKDDAVRANIAMFEYAANSKD